MQTSKVAGIGGLPTPWSPDDETDPERKRIVQSLLRLGWNQQLEMFDIQDPNTMAFFVECGGFPLRALDGIEEMREAYERAKREGNVQLHIDKAWHDSLPDIIPPSPQSFDRATYMQDVGFAEDVLCHQRKRVEYSYRDTVLGKDVTAKLADPPIHRPSVLASRPAVLRPVVGTGRQRHR